LYRFIRFFSQKLCICIALNDTFLSIAAQHCLQPIPVPPRVEVKGRKSSFCPPLFSCHSGSYFCCYRTMNTELNVVLVLILMCILIHQSWASASRPMVFWHPSFSSSTGTFRYRSRHPYSGGLVPVSACFFSPN
jgi:hypothetical protein